MIDPSIRLFCEVWLADSSLYRLYLVDLRDAANALSSQSSNCTCWLLATLNMGSDPQRKPQRSNKAWMCHGSSTSLVGRLYPPAPNDRK
jgi:hypothetical protein